MYHLKYKGFSYNPFIIIDFLILTNEVFKLPKHLTDASESLQESMDTDKEKYNWLYNKEDSYLFHDFCQDKEHGMLKYLQYFDDDYNELIDITHIWMAFTYIYYSCHSGEEPTIDNGTNEMNLYIDQFKLLGTHKTLDWEWIDTPIEKRWWINDNEMKRWTTYNNLSTNPR
jgi:hypothetical protein